MTHSRNTVPKRLLVVYHSMTGGTAQMVKAFAEGANEEPAVVIDYRQASDTNASHVLQAHGLVFATPENLASMSGQLKDFFDRTYYDALDKVNGLPYGIMICAGSDGHAAARQIERIATGWRLKLVQPALIVNTKSQTPQQILAPKHLSLTQLEPCRQFGALFAAALSISVF